MVIISCPGIICGSIWGSFPVRGSFAGLYSTINEEIWGFFLSNNVAYIFISPENPRLLRFSLACLTSMFSYEFRNVYKNIPGYFDNGECEYFRFMCCNQILTPQYFCRISTFVKKICCYINHLEVFHYTVNNHRNVQFKGALSWRFCSILVKTRLKHLTKNVFANMKLLLELQ